MANVDLLDQISYFVKDYETNYGSKPSNIVISKDNFFKLKTQFKNSIPTYDGIRIYGIDHNNPNYSIEATQDLLWLPLPGKANGSLKYRLNNALVKADHNCECGSDKIGSSLHSHWCPKN